VKPNHAVGLMEYSNYNYVILGALIEAVSGQSYASYMKEHIRGPLGMEHTFFSDSEAKADGGVSGYRLLFGRAQAWEEPYKPSMQSSGYILSSAEDVGRLGMLYLNQGFSAGGDNILGDAAQSADGYYSIYWQWIGGAIGKNLPEHGGAMLTSSSAIRIYPADDLAVVVLLNCRPDAYFNSLNATTLLDGVAAIALGYPVSAPTDRGWGQAVREFNTQVAIYLGVVVVLLIFSMIWRRRLLHVGWLRILFGVLAALELGLAAYGLISTPLSNHASWPLLLLIAPDLNGMVLLLAALLIVLAGLQLSVLWRKGRREKAELGRLDRLRGE
jgi:CubicO group peptidase (beta-lactamase class C family)